MPGDKTASAGLLRIGPLRTKETGMDQAHIAALQTRHAGLDRRIAEENQRPMPDSALIARLKKEKLKLKEEIAGIVIPAS